MLTTPPHTTKLPGPGAPRKKKLLRQRRKLVFTEQQEVMSDLDL